MTSRHRFLTLSLLAGITACAYSSVDVPIVSPVNAVLSLAGEWAGKYSGSGGAGTIAFRFEAGDTIVFGDVLMVPREYLRPGATSERARGPQRAPSLLTIVFVGDAAGRVSGTLDPYIDADCDCVVITEFFGRRVSPDELEGTYMTRPTGTAIIQTGSWRVTRQDRTR